MGMACTVFLKLQIHILVCSKSTLREETYNLHLQHAPICLTAFIPARANSLSGPRRPEAQEALEPIEAWLPDRSDRESKTISWYSGLLATCTLDLLLNMFLNPLGLRSLLPKELGLLVTLGYVVLACTVSVSIHRGGQGPNRSALLTFEALSIGDMDRSVFFLFLEIPPEGGFSCIGDEERAEFISKTSGPASYLVFKCVASGSETSELRTLFLDVSGP